MSFSSASLIYYPSTNHIEDFYQYTNEKASSVSRTGSSYDSSDSYSASRNQQAAASSFSNFNNGAKSSGWDSSGGWDDCWSGLCGWYGGWGGGYGGGSDSGWNSKSFSSGSSGDSNSINLNENVQSSHSESASSSSYSNDQYSKEQVTAFHYVNAVQGPRYGSYDGGRDYSDDSYLGPDVSYRDHGYSDVVYLNDPSQSSVRSYYGSEDYYYQYVPYLKTYERKKCYHYPPADAWVYTKCPDY